MLFLRRMLPIYIKDRSIEVRRFLKLILLRLENILSSHPAIGQWQKTICFNKTLRAPFSVSEAVMSLP